MPQLQTNVYGDSSFAVAVETKNQGFYQEMRAVDTAFDKYSMQNKSQNRRRNSGQSGLIIVATLLVMMVGGIVTGAVTGMIQSSDKIEAKAAFDESLAAGTQSLQTFYDQNKLPELSTDGNYKFVQKADGSFEVQENNK